PRSGPERSGVLDHPTCGAGDAHTNSAGRCWFGQAKEPDNVAADETISKTGELSQMAYRAESVFLDLGAVGRRKAQEILLGLLGKEAVFFFLPGLLLPLLAKRFIGLLLGGFSRFLLGVPFCLGNEALGSGVVLADGVDQVAAWVLSDLLVL